MIDYKYVADLLRPNYRLVICKTKSHSGEIKTTGIKYHVSSIDRERHLDYAKGLFAGNGLNIHYNPNEEDLYVEIPE